ncbi:uncharacterized protein LOC111519067 [Drosophila willistoni]|uniref:uncharacterized protein LOC111519067 n=1 Tax=Drosophila willistoni TaxID=7260 RepID=UPI00017D8468|nr:uncharacterized protein LOC111519067 [Drosophila willistoni]
MDQPGEGGSSLPKIPNIKCEDQRSIQKTELLCDCFIFCCEGAIESAMLKTIDRVIDGVADDRTDNDNPELDHLISTAARSLPLMKVTQAVGKISDLLKTMIVKYGTDPEVPPKLVTELFKEVERLSHTILKWKQKLVMQAERARSNQP